MIGIREQVQQLRSEGYIEGELSTEPLWYQIWEPENLCSLNEEYQVAALAPGFIAFGSNGGNDLLW